MFRNLQVRTVVPYALSALVLLTLSGCKQSPGVVTVTPPPSATSSGASGPNNVVIETKVPHVEDYTATPVRPTETPIPSDTPNVSSTPAPTATMSGSAIPQGVKNAQTFNSAVPPQIGPFQLVSSMSAAYQYGSVLYYRTEDGALYTVVMYLTNDDNDAIVRFQGEAQSMANPQPLKLGDEGFFSMVDTHTVAIIHYRNVVIDIYRPDPSGTVPTIKLTDDQVKQLATQIFQSIPKP